MEAEYARIQQLYYGPPPTPSPSPELDKPLVVDPQPQPLEKAEPQIQPVEPPVEPFLINEDIVHCDICGGKYTHYNKNRHERTAKHKKKQASYTVSDSSTFVITTSEEVAPI